ncbi:hypothetical protein ZIOFF_009430 [Zingiber officinale]|uniref:Uncharacterized protein n=1 Tax=Zingiber officinale TaxID=94328 RepID=A0A8J5I2R9_ZINOF|nr:hypothetical protein ZIOFF_009430 [Zingiber officinale]
MGMVFRSRDYGSEEIACSLARRIADDHPLALRSSTSSQVIPDSDISFDDPLRANTADPSESMNWQNNCSTFKNRCSSEADNLLKKEWILLKGSLTQKFTSSNTIAVSQGSNCCIIVSKRWRSMVLFIYIRYDSKEQQRYVAIVSLLVAKLLSSECAGDKSLADIHLEEQDYLETSLEEEKIEISRKEYFLRLQELKGEINLAWRSEDRIRALKLSIKVARLLMDTSVLQFYPTLFTLVVDVMDMFGTLVWERIRKRAEYANDGTLLRSLPDYRNAQVVIVAYGEDFISDDICSEAKETCYNWFCKIGSIHELVPRIYLELAILRCWRFLDNNFTSILQRLVMMMRGIADPLASAYCHLYLANSARFLYSGDDGGYLIMSLRHLSILLRRIILDKEAVGRHFSKNKRVLISLMEPSIEWIMKCIFSLGYQNTRNILEEFGVARDLSVSSWKFPCVSLVLHYLLKLLPADVISDKAVEIIDFVEQNKDISVESHLVYRRVGHKLCESRLSLNSSCAVMDRIMQVLVQYNNLYEYLMIADAYLDIILLYSLVTAPRGGVLLSLPPRRHLLEVRDAADLRGGARSRLNLSFTTSDGRDDGNLSNSSSGSSLVGLSPFREFSRGDGLSTSLVRGGTRLPPNNYLSIMLDGILKRSHQDKVDEIELDILQSILVKIINHLDRLEDMLALDLSLPQFSSLNGRAGCIDNPCTIQFLFEVSQVLHESIDISNMNDENKQKADLISKFVGMVNFGADLERHLSFLCDSRAAFGNIEEVKILKLHMAWDFLLGTLSTIGVSMHLTSILVHSSNNLGIKFFRDKPKFLSFLKSCLAFNDVTLPSVSDRIRRMNLYLESAEIALFGGLISHSEGFIISVISCLQCLDMAEDSWKELLIKSPGNERVNFISIVVIARHSTGMSGARHSTGLVGGEQKKGKAGIYSRSRGWSVLHVFHTSHESIGISLPHYVQDEEKLAFPRGGKNWRGEGSSRLGNEIGKAQRENTYTQEGMDWKGNHEDRSMYLVQDVITTFRCQSLVSPRTKVQIFCAIISLSASLSQKELLYYAINTEVVSNAQLFFGDLSFFQELSSIANLTIQILDDVIQQEPNSATRGRLALDICNCLLISYRRSQELLLKCSSLIDIAKECLHTRDKYLQSTMSLFSRLPSNLEG